MQEWSHNVFLKEVGCHAVYVPTEENDSVKEYLRMRDDHKLALKKIKQQINVFCLRHGHYYTQSKWTIAHWKWLKKLELNTMLFICYPKCSTCQKARKWLDEHNIQYTERHIVEENPSYEELKQWHEKSGLPLKKFFNTSGMIYRKMDLKNKLPEMEQEEQLRLLATDGMLVKRPLIVTEDHVLVGFKEKEWEILL